MPSVNRKVRGATVCSLDGILFRSKQEARMWTEMKDTDLKCEHEPEPIVLEGKFTPSRPWYRKGKATKSPQRQLTYLPDFLVRGKRNTYIIEVKGFQTDRYMVKRRLLLQWLESHPDNVFFEVHTLSDMRHCIETIKQLENGF